jgi:hypothetical protein
MNSNGVEFIAENENRARGEVAEQYASGQQDQQNRLNSHLSEFDVTFQRESPASNQV